MCSYVTDTALQKKEATEHNTRSAFYLSSSILSLYPRSMGRRLHSDLDDATIMELSEKGRNAFYGSEAELRKFADANAVALPTMVMAGADVFLKCKIPSLVKMSESNHPVIAYANAEALDGINRRDRRRIDEMIKVLIRSIREVRDNGPVPRV